MGKLSYIGIDVGKYTLSCSAPDRRVREFSNDIKGIRLLLQHASQACKDDELMFVMEATGVYSEKLAGLLTSLADVQVAILPPSCVVGFMRSKVFRTKNDRVDAVAIRRYGELIKPTATLRRSESQRRLRQLLIVLDGLKDTASRYKCKMEALSQTAFPDEVAIGIMQAAMSDNARHQAELQDAIDNVLKQDDELAGADERIRSIPGVGRGTSTLLLAICYEAILNLSQRQLLAFCGMSPRECQSGASRGQTRMSKQGDSRIRKMLYMVAMQMISKNGIMRDYYQSLKEKKGERSGKPALVCVMRKALYLIQAVVRNDTHFQLDYQSITS